MSSAALALVVLLLLIAMYAMLAPTQAAQEPGSDQGTDTVHSGSAAEPTRPEDAAAGE